jgi:uncharacterized protein (DUF927 family)
MEDDVFGSKDPNSTADDASSGDTGYTKSGSSPGTPTERFAALFHGNEADAWGSYRYTGKVDLNGKKEKQSLTHQPAAREKTGLDRELVPKDWEGHLAGSKDRIGCCPVIDRTDNKVLWGAIDIDSKADPKVDINAMVQAIESAGYPLVATVSPSAGAAHVYLFADKPVPAADMIAKLNEYREKLWLDPKTEIYPRKPTLPAHLLKDDGKVNCGPWLAHPYHGDTTYAITSAGPVADSKTFNREVMDYLESKRMNAAWFRPIEPKEPETKTETGPEPQTSEPFELPDFVEQGSGVGRNPTLYKHGCSLRGKGAEEAEIREKIIAANIERMRPPLDEDDINLIISQVMKLPKGVAVGGGEKVWFFYHPKTGELWTNRWTRPKTKKGEPLAPMVTDPIRVCSRIVALGEVNDATRAAAGLLLEITGRTGLKTTHIIPRELAEKPHELFPLLARLDVVLDSNPSAAFFLRKFIRAAVHDKKVLLVHETGWHGDVYVLPDQQYGTGQETIRFEGAPADHPFRLNGTLIDWQTDVSAMCVGNSRLVHAVCAAFAGPMLRFYSGATNPGFHDWGRGSQGKTTTLKVAGSVCGGKDRATGYSESWRSTDNALEGTAKLHNHGLLCLDEIKQLDPRKIIDAVHLLGNGGGKTRMKRDGGQRETQTFQLVTLSTGEKPISDIVARSGAKGVGEAGQTVRLIDIPAEPDGAFGVFEELHDFGSGAAFADHVMKAVRANYGHALHLFLTKLTENMDDMVESYRGKVKEILREFTKGIAGTDGESLRVAESFAIVAAAGELASGVGVTTWPYGTATWGCGKCFKDWLKNHGAGASDDNAFVNFIKETLQKFGNSRFEELLQEESNRGSARSVGDRLGYWWPKFDGGRVYFFLPESFKEYCTKNGHDVKRGMKALSTEGMIAVKDNRPGYQYTRKIDGVPVRGYALWLAGEVEIEDEPSREEAMPPAGQLPLDIAA